MEACKREELPLWTGPVVPKAYKKNTRREREAYYRRPLVPACVVPPYEPYPKAEERQRRMRRDCVLEGLERG